MGGGSFDPKAYTAYTRTTAGKSTADIYSATGLHSCVVPRLAHRAKARAHATSLTGSPPLAPGISRRRTRNEFRGSKSVQESW